MAGCLLIQEEDRYLEPSEVLKRLKSVFKNVVFSQVRAVEEIEGTIEYLQSQKSRGVWIGYPFDEEIAELKNKAEDAVYLVISDEKKPRFKYLSTLVLPDEPLFFGFFSERHQKEAMPLIQRCAEVLGYEIEE